MLISDVCKNCKLTRKAVEYYEQQGLICPEIMENGYRNYSDKDIAVLKEISMLRKLDMSISDIKTIVFSHDKCNALANYQMKRELLLEQAKAQFDCINQLISNGYDVEKTTHYIEHALDHNTMILDKLLQAFPGDYGHFLSVHFGRFLCEKIDTADKAMAYQKIVNYLDSIKGFSLSEELSEFMESMSKNQAMIDLKKMEGTVSAVLDDYERYIEKNKDHIEQYLELRNSEEYKSSPAFQMQKAMIDFQQSTGYNDLFIPNLKILSQSYTTYMRKLEIANNKFMEHFPQSKSIYKNNDF